MATAPLLAQPETPLEAPRSFRPSSAPSFRLQLTKRETEVLQLVADGLLNKQIAQRLFVSPETIKSCVDGIRLKLDATNRAHAASIGLRAGLID
jgi:two-component system, NarL family, response regulator LiaR